MEEDSSIPFESSPKSGENGSRVIPTTMPPDELSRARVGRWDETMALLAGIADASDTDEVWDEVLENLGIESGPESEGLRRVHHR